MTNVLTLEEIYNAVVAVKGTVSMSERKHLIHNCDVYWQAKKILRTVNNILRMMEIIMKDPVTFTRDNDLYKLRQDITNEIYGMQTDLKRIEMDCLK